MKKRANEIDPGSLGPVTITGPELGPFKDGGAPFVSPWHPDAQEAFFELGALPWDGSSFKGLTPAQVFDHREQVGLCLKHSWAHPTLELEGVTGEEVFNELAPAFGAFIYHIVNSILRVVSYGQLATRNLEEQAKELADPKGGSGEPN